MKRGITVLVSLSAVLTVAYFTASKWAIRHETLTFNDPARDNRPVAVDIAVRRDKEMQANAGMIKLPVAILSHGMRRDGDNRNRLLGIVLCVHGLVAQLSIVERTLYSAPPGRVTCTIYANSISWTSLRRPLRQSVSILALRPFLKQLSPPGRFRMWGIIKVSLKRKMSSPFPGSQ